METGTADRLERLAQMRVLKPDFAREVTQAFRYLMGLRLDGQLAQSGGRSGSLVRPSALSSMERDLLRDAFLVIKDFRELVRRHFNLGMF